MPVFLSAYASVRLEERKEIITQLCDGGYSVVISPTMKMAKLHVRYMVGGRPPPLQERLYSFEFPSRPRVAQILSTMLTRTRNISLFHYRSHGKPIMAACWRRSS